MIPRTSSQQRRAWAAPIVGAAAGAALLAVGAPAGAHAPAGAVTVSGEVSGLYPGAQAVLEATVSNDSDAALTIAALVVEAADAHPECPGSLLSFDDGGPRVQVPAGERATIPVIVRLDRAAPDACQGATWHLTFSALGPGAAQPLRGPSSGPAPSAAEDEPAAGPARMAFTGGPVRTLLLSAGALLAAGGAALGGARLLRGSAR